MFEESYFQNTWRWFAYRRKKQVRERIAERMYYSALAGAPRGGLVLDLGANVGDTVKAALSMGLEVIAFEPDPAALKTLRERFPDHAKLAIIPKAVGGSSRIAKFYRRPDENTEWSSLNHHDVHDGGEVMSVEVVDIVDFVRGLNRQVAVLKMDIEGAEAECLEAILDAGLHRSIGQILVETHERFSPELAERIERIRKRISCEHITNIDLGWL